MRMFKAPQGPSRDSTTMARPSPVSWELPRACVASPSAPGGHEFERFAIHPQADASAADFELEADRVAEDVAQMPEPLEVAPRRTPACTERPSGQPAARLRHTKRPRGDACPPPDFVRDVVSSPGRPLDASTRAFMEPRLGVDLARVRLHDDTRAAESAQALGAQAYTTGAHVVLGPGNNPLDSLDGRRLIAHELAHVIQQGFSPRAIQRKDKKKPAGKNVAPKKGTTNAKMVFEQIKKRDPALAELITPQSIDFRSPKKPPVIKAGPVKDGEEHVWQVRVLAAQGFSGSQISVGGEERKKMKTHTRVTHYLDLVWALPMSTDPDFSQQTGSADEAFTLTAAISLYHELLHARLIMERDPNWTNQHSKAFEDYSAIIAKANSPALAAQKQEVTKIIKSMAAGGGVAKDVAQATENYYEFLVHEKYDATRTGSAFAKTYPNSLIATQYSKVVARRLGLDLDNAAFKLMADKLATAAEKLFDALD